MKLAKAVVRLGGAEKPPLRFVAGADAMQAIEAKLDAVHAQIEAQRELSASLGHALA